MSTYIFSKWKNPPKGSPVEFYSELDGMRYEVRKVEVYENGELGYASKMHSSANTSLGTIPVPSVGEILSQAEFEIKDISKQEFEEIWKKASKS